MVVYKNTNRYLDEVISSTQSQRFLRIMTKGDTHVFRRISQKLYEDVKKRQPLDMAALETIPKLFTHPSAWNWGGGKRSGSQWHWEQSPSKDEEGR